VPDETDEDEGEDEEEGGFWQGAASMLIDTGTESNENKVVPESAALLSCASHDTHSTKSSMGIRSKASYANSAIDSKLRRIRSKDQSRAPLDCFWECVLREKAEADETVWGLNDQLSNASSQILDNLSQTIADAVSGDESTLSTGRKSRDESSVSVGIKSCFLYTSDAADDLKC